MTEEERRLEEARQPATPWKKWGPYLSERQWGTVREDYSDTGNAWDYFSHDQARSRAYRWGEDGLAGISDDRQILCFALALWNGADPIIKERAFGLTNSEGNHGEDVKEYFFYLDSTPTHSYMKYLYKYPQAAYPYDQLVGTNRRRNRYELEYELLDTGVFANDRYFDVFVEYAKAAPEDILVRLTVANRGPEPAVLHVLPTLWFRNTWSWGGEAPKLGLRRLEGPRDVSVVAASHAELGERYLYCAGGPPLLFTENETNAERIFKKPNASPWVKDAIDTYLVHGKKDAVNPAQIGTKVAAHYPVTVEAGKSTEIRLRLSSADLAAHLLCMLEHVDHHRDHHHGRHGREEGFPDRLYCDLREKHAEHRREQRRRAGAPPRRRDQAVTASLAQVRDGDGNDEEGLDPLAEREHRHLQHLRFLDLGGQNELAVLGAAQAILPSLVLDDQFAFTPEQLLAHHPVGSGAHDRLTSLISHRIG